MYGMFSGSCFYHRAMDQMGRYPANLLVSGNALDLVKKGESRFFSLDAWGRQHLNVPFDRYCCEFRDDNKKWGHWLFEWCNVLYCKKCGVGMFIDVC